MLRAEPSQVWQIGMSASFPSVIRPGAAGRLSGQVVGQLGPGEQLILWAFRQRLRDGATPSPAFLQGFRLAFGLAFLEPALSAFDRLFQALHHHGRRDIALFPLHCACVSADERAVIHLVAAAQAGEGPWLEAAAARLVEPGAAALLREGAVGFALALQGEGLALAPLAGVVPASRAAWH